MVDVINRRDFMVATGIATAGLVGGCAIGGKSPVSQKAVLRQWSPNEKVIVAVFGIHSRGLALSNSFAENNNCNVKYVVDVDSRHLARAAKQAADRQGNSPQTLRDFRKALDDKDVDAVVIATPDHWHAPMTIEALKAGKHVYVEKPCSHNPAEGELLVKAQKKYGYLVQMGTQRRSLEVTKQLVREVKEGLIGRISYANCWYRRSRGPIGFGKKVPVPDYLDWELWQGPAPREAYRDNIHPYNWHWFYTWGTGEALNNATHEVDVARWVMGLGFPSKVTSMGGRFKYNGKDDWQFYDTQNIGLEFASGQGINWEGLSTTNFSKYSDGRGVLFYGDKGAIEYLSSHYNVYDNDGKKVKTVGEVTNSDTTNTADPGLGMAHSANFIDAIRGNNKLSSPIEEGHKSVTLCQLGNIAQRSGVTLHCDPANGHILNDREAKKLWSRDYESGWEPKI